MEEVFKFSSLNSVTFWLAAKVAGVALLMAIVFYGISLGYNYIKHSYKPDSQFPNYEEISRTVIILLMIVFYVPLMSAIYFGVNSVHKALQPDRTEITKQVADLKIQEYKQMKEGESQCKVCQELIEIANKKGYESVKNSDEYRNCKSMVDAGCDKDGITTGDVANVLGGLNLASVIGKIVTTLIISLISGLIRLVMIGFASITLQLLFVVGSLSLAFSIIPAFKNSFENFIATFINVCFVIITIDLLDTIWWALMVGDADNIIKFTGTTDIAIKGLLQIVSYASVFWLTSKYIGKGDAGMLAGKAFALGGMVAAAGITAMTGGAGAGAAGSVTSKLTDSLKASGKSQMFE